MATEHILKNMDWFGYLLIAVTMAMIIFLVISLILGK